jgi:hypothetical protein
MNLDLIALMTDIVSTSETSVYFYRAKQHNIPEDSHPVTLLGQMLAGGVQIQTS